MVSLKDRRQSGRYTPKATCSPKELKKENLFINEEYDDWQDHRDGFRDWFRDGKTIKNSIKRKYKRGLTEHDIKRKKLNDKQKKLLQRRKVRK